MDEVKIKKFKFFFLILCITQLFYIFHFRSGFKYEIIKSPFNEKSGIHYALSSEIIELNGILIKHKATNFNLSEGFKKDTYLYQRAIEFNYPIRIDENSRLIFFLNKEDIPITCKVIENGENLILAKC